MYSKNWQSWCSAVISDIICNERGVFELQFHLIVQIIVALRRKRGMEGDRRGRKKR